MRNQIEHKQANEQILLQRMLDARYLNVASSSNISKDKFFEYFCSEVILHDYGLSAEQILEGVVDGNGDGGIDCFYAFHNQTLVTRERKISASKENHIDLVVIQTKNTNGFGSDAILKIRDALETILDYTVDDKEITKRFNPNVADKAIAFRNAHAQVAGNNDRVHIHIYYCSKATLVGQEQQIKSDDVKTSCKKKLPFCRVDFHFVGANELYKLSNRMSRTIKADLELTEILINTSVRGYIGLIKLADYYKFITEDGRLNVRLFDANVRDYQGNTEVNLEIEKTLKEPTGEDFWWLNNGVSIIAESVAPVGKTLKLKEPQIVNGLQTSYEIYKYLQNAASKHDDRHLMVRVIQIPDEEKANRDHIIKATNSQTQIPKGSLRSTDPIHRMIEEYLCDHGLYYDRRKSYYSNQGKAIDKIVTIESLAQAYNAICLASPKQSRALGHDILSNDAIYRDVFNNRKLPAYKNCLFLTALADAKIKSSGFTRGSFHIKYHLAYVIAGLLTSSQKPSENQIAQLFIDNLASDNSDCVDFAYEQIFNLIQKEAKLVHDTEKYSKSPKFESSCKDLVKFNIRRFYRPENFDARRSAD